MTQRWDGVGAVASTQRRRQTERTTTASQRADEYSQRRGHGDGVTTGATCDLPTHQPISETGDRESSNLEDWRQK